MRFEGKVALIAAGGAGIGRATAGIIGREGGTVVVVDVDPAAADRAAKDITAAGGRRRRSPATGSTPATWSASWRARWRRTGASTSS